MIKSEQEIINELGLIFDSTVEVSRILMNHSTYKGNDISDILQIHVTATIITLIRTIRYDPFTIIEKDEEVLYEYIGSELFDLNSAIANEYGDDILADEKSNAAVIAVKKRVFVSIASHIRSILTNG